MKVTFVTTLLLLALCCQTADAQSQPNTSPNTKTTTMKEFILLVRVPATYTTEQASAVNPLWEAVTGKWKNEGIWVTSFVFPGEGFVLSGADKQVKNEYVLANNLKLVSTIILKAASLASAVALSKACPVLNYGGSIEVREVIPAAVKP